ncbi:hypothetical protein ACLKA6_010154 [Drosophila palustris]
MGGVGGTMLITVAEGAKVREDLLLRPAFSTAPPAVFKSAAGGADASSDEDGALMVSHLRTYNTQEILPQIGSRQFSLKSSGRARSRNLAFAPFVLLSSLARTAVRMDNIVQLRHEVCTRERFIKTIAPNSSSTPRVVARRHISEVTVQTGNDSDSEEEESVNLDIKALTLSC